MKMIAPLTVDVTWNAGETKPEHFFLGARQVLVEELLDRWDGTDHEYIKVRGDDRAIYILRHDDRTASWQLTLYNSGDPDPRTRLSST